MKKIFIAAIMSFALLSIAHAQEKAYKLSKKTGNLKILLTGAKIEGYDGSEIILTAPERKPDEKDERADGLRLISGSGLKDNTGLGVSMEDKDNVVTVSYVSKRDHDDITIKVPNSMSITIKTSDVIHNRPFEIKNFKGELEIGTVYNTINLENVTGPINAKTIYGSLTAKFAQSIKGPISLVSVYKFVDATIPSSLKANISLSTQYGNVYAAEGLDIKRDAVKAKANDDDDLTGMTDWSKSSDIKGTLNGGGIDFILKSSYGKIYLRKG
ncbi:MAG: hypothetical protein DI598_09780 [Pseudopedobacter saltans]|uniref:Adhesin domain-containing protein n=1 Tax=Pseudopedobacter saltans TaxID=151895 RepID=A0A2W5EX97_9SPHI|nr:MAG: hypothetical protein DI598_09780 [Pseudopedobacter saltans]